MVYEVPVTQARAEFADLVNRVVYAGERVVLTRHGKPIAALVSAEDLARLEESTVDEPARVIRLASDHRPGATGPARGHRLDAAASVEATAADDGPGPTSHDGPGPTSHDGPGPAH